MRTSFLNRRSHSPYLVLTSLGIAPILLLSLACESSSLSGWNGGSATGGVATGGGTMSGGTTGSSGGSGGGGPSTGGSSVGGAPSTGGVPAAGGAMVETVECAGEFPADTPPAEPQHTITVDNAGSWGAWNHFYNTYGNGRYGLYLPQNRMSHDGREWADIIREHTVDGVENLGLKALRMHGLFHDDIGIYKEDSEGKPVYDFTKSDQIFDFFVEHNISQILELAPMPSALASDPTKTVFDYKMGISPPKDFQKWQDLVKAFVQHSVDRYGEEVVSQWYFEVWNEPECCSGKFWTGGLEKYFELYDHSAAGVRAVLPNARIGGPVSSQPAELTGNSMAGQLFLDHINSTNNYVTPGSTGILDFFAFHSWSFIAGAVDGYFQGLDLLDSKGKTNVPIAVTEFGPTYKFKLEFEPQEMTQGAAFAIQTYADISRKAAQDNRRLPIAYAWWVLSDVFDEEVLFEGDPFIGCMGLTSREGLHKPAYNAFKFLSQMGDTQIPLTINGPGGVGGLATRDAGGGIQIVLYNGQNPGRGPFDDTYYQVTDAHNITVSLSGIDPEITYNVIESRVDATHGNAYDIWQNKGRPPMDVMTEADWQELRSNMDSKPETLGSAVCGTTFQRSVSLPSPGVVFLKLEPATTAPVD